MQQIRRKQYCSLSGLIWGCLQPHSVNPVEIAALFINMLPKGKKDCNSYTAQQQWMWIPGESQHFVLIVIVSFGNLVWWERAKKHIAVVKEDCSVYPSQCLLTLIGFGIFNKISTGHAKHIKYDTFYPLQMCFCLAWCNVVSLEYTARLSAAIVCV